MFPSAVQADSGIKTKFCTNRIQHPQKNREAELGTETMAITRSLIDKAYFQQCTCGFLPFFSVINFKSKQLFNMLQFGEAIQFYHFSFILYKRDALGVRNSLKIQMSLMLSAPFNSSSFSWLFYHFWRELAKSTILISLVYIMFCAWNSQSFESD